ncbi:hypothetical protein [Methylovulum psychrotolerans]|nr:hypothetical protein [Methylovulum psychrotolerans]
MCRPFLLPVENAAIVETLHRNVSSHLSTGEASPPESAIVQQSTHIHLTQ